MPKKLDSRTNITSSTTTARQSSSCYPKIFIDAFPKPPIHIKIDLDTTDNPLHGRQKKPTTFHG